MSMPMQRAAKRAKTAPMINPLAAMMAPVNMMNQMAMLGGMGGMGAMGGGMGGGMNPVMNSMMHLMNPESNMDDHHDDEVEVAESLPDSSSSAAAPARVPAAAAVVPAVPVAGHPALGGIPDEDNDPAQGHVHLSDAVISRSCTTLKDAARSRLSHCLELMNGMFDATYTAECSKHGILILVWIMTRVKPRVKISDLRIFDLEFDFIQFW